MIALQRREAAQREARPSLRSTLMLWRSVRAAAQCQFTLYNPPPYYGAQAVGLNCTPGFLHY